MLTSTGALRARWAVLMVLVAGLLVAGANVVYTGHVQRQGDAKQEQARHDFERRQAELRHEQDRRWCPLLVSLDQPGVPATTERGRAIQQQIHQLRIETGC